jgi:hypothetical protein
VMMSPAASARVDQYDPAVFKNPETINKQFRLFWIGVGKDDGLTGPGDRAFVENAEETWGQTHVRSERRAA